MIAQETGSRGYDTDSGLIHLDTKLIPLDTKKTDSIRYETDSGLIQLDTKLT